jgi:hypothetical protein
VDYEKSKDSNTIPCRWFCEDAKVIIILVLASEKLREMTNFVSVSEFPLFENNQHYVK